MTELFSHRKLALNAQNKYDLDQLFKTKMKLINEPFAATSSLNTHSIPRSPSYTASMSNVREFLKNLLDLLFFVVFDCYIQACINKL